MKIVAYRLKIKKSGSMDPTLPYYSKLAIIQRETSHRVLDGKITIRPRS